MPRFSLFNLLVLTALIAVGAALGTAYQRNRSLKLKRDELQAISSRLQVDDPDVLTSAETPQIADDFSTWHVHVPDGRDYELRLGLGSVSANGIPQNATGVKIAPGRHRVTLHTGDSPSEEFRYVVYVDGESAIDSRMGAEWIPGGWSSGSSLMWPRDPAIAQGPLQLSARSYEPKIEFEGGKAPFNGQSDWYVTRKGYRLWIDESARTYPPASPMIGFSHDPIEGGVGLRDGLRYRPDVKPSCDWSFSRPSLNTNDPVLQISAEFDAAQVLALSRATHAFSWQLRDDVLAKEKLNWPRNSTQSTYSAFLHAQVAYATLPQPVIEMKWETSRPDEVGLRIAETPANDRFKKWRLRFLDGTQHLWRKLHVDDLTIDADETTDDNATASSYTLIPLNLDEGESRDVILDWQTDEKLPLQVLQRRQPGYAGFSLYQGLPLTVGVRIPAVLKPTLKVSRIDTARNAPGTSLPGGPVFREIVIELETMPREFIWVNAKPMN
ncbi:MAG: hypothetical protein KDA61_16095 [Planctomycetales bacterium]|nr:hypothetical protein [Planctomycetales bacterium]